MGGAKKSSKKASKKVSKKSSKKVSKKSSKKVSKTGSKKHKDMHSQEMESAPKPTKEAAKPAKSEKRAPNPALAAFAKLSKHVSEKLDIPNGPNAKRVAGAANREIKEKNPGMPPVDVAEAAIKLINENTDRFKKILENLLK